jgi:hypothetical protein
MEPERQPVLSGDGENNKKKRPYSKPACVSEEIFETTALACGKRYGQSGQCNALPSAS